MIWKLFNQFFIKLDRKPRDWNQRLVLFVCYLIDNKKQSSTVRSYISAIKAVLKDQKIEIKEDEYLLPSLTKACRLKNDVVNIHIPIQKGLMKLILKAIDKHYANIQQPYLRLLYLTLFSTAYYSLFRVGELTAGNHPVLAKDVQIGDNKKNFSSSSGAPKHMRNMQNPSWLKLPAQTSIGKNTNPGNPGIGAHINS